jgi:hypothetical protein
MPPGNRTHEPCNQNDRSKEVSRHSQHHKRVESMSLEKIIYNVSIISHKKVI